MTVRVDPDELRHAADELVPGPHEPYNPKSDAGAFTSAAIGLGTLETGRALVACRRAAESAVEIVRDRLEEWQYLLKESADTYHDSDIAAARRLAALGDFNTAPDSGPHR